MLTFRAVGHHLVHITAFGRRRVGSHGYGTDTAATQVLLAGVCGQQSAVGAHGYLGQAGVAIVESGIAQILMDAFHNAFP